MKPGRLYFRNVEMPVWKWDGVIIAGGTAQDCADFIQTNMHAEIDVADDPIGHAYVRRGMPWVLWVQALQNVPTLAHEALHIAIGILEGRGLSPTSESEEAYTYTLEAILRAALSKKYWSPVRVRTGKKQTRRQ